MSILKLKGSSSGYVELTAPATAGNNQITLPTTAGTVAVIDGSGRLGINTTSPGSSLQVNGSGGIRVNEDGAGTYQIQLRSDWASQGPAINVQSNHSLIFATNGTERARFDSSGRLAVNTTSPNTDLKLSVNGAIGAGDYVSHVSNKSLQVKFYNTGASSQFLGLAAEDSSTAVDGDTFKIFRQGSAAERARITPNGFFKASNTGSYQGASGTYHEFRTDLDDQCLYLHGSNASWNNHLILGRATQSANSSYKFILFQSGNGGDTEFNLRGDGNAYADGSWNGGGADYAEYFEWYDANPEAEDRRGISVVLDDDKIREAQEGEDPIGVISGNPSVVGDAAWNKWSGKYLRDEYGTYIQEDYEVTDEDGNIVIQQRRKLNPAYDPDVEYISREDRPEWDCVGLMGKLRIRKGQVTGSRWIKMRDITDSVEEWLVR